MELHVTNGLYWLKAAYDDKDIAKAAGFRWNPQVQAWQSPDTYAARKLLAYATPDCKAHLDIIVAEQERTRALSRATTLDVELPCPEGLAYLPFQKAGIVFCGERPAVLLGDEMGTGKSVEALGMLNVCTEVHSVLIVCPNTLKLTWRNEAQKWLMPSLDYHIEVITAHVSRDDLMALYTHKGGHQRVMAIIHYEILHKFCHVVDFPTAGKTKVQTYQFLAPGFVIDTIVVDEAHRMKGDTRQTRAIQGVTAVRKVLLSGSPIPNRPKELWNLLHFLDPLAWPTFFPFGLRYCGGSRGPFGWNFDGSSHEDELQDVLRSQYMIRRLKKDAMKELPPKRRQVIELSPHGSATLINAEWKAYSALQKGAQGIAALKAALELAKASDDEEEYRHAVENLKEGQSAAFRDMAKVREATALAKLDQALEHIMECLETEAKVVVYFWHHAVASILAEKLAQYLPAIIIGSTSAPKRYKEVERFQADPDCRVFLGSIAAAGEGITLTAASLMIIVELDWVPKNMKQVEDRLHRMTQCNPVLIRYLVFEGSLDATMLRTIIQKMQVIESILDTEHHFQVDACEKNDAVESVERFPMVFGASDTGADDDPAHAPATAMLRRQQVAQDALQIAPAEVTHVHRALQYLAGVCDFAHAKDGQGFNMIDARIGHELARQHSLSPRQAVLGQTIIQKYRNQLAGFVQV